MEKSETVKYQKKEFSMNVYCDPFNQRIRIDDYLGNIAKIITSSEYIAGEKNAEKLIVKARAEHFRDFIKAGYRLEGMIDSYFLGSDCLFLSKFFTAERKNSNHWLKEEEITQKVLLLEKQPQTVHLAADYKPKKLTELDADELANLYGQVFEIYPTPLNNPKYIKQTMQEGTIYFGVEYKGEIVSAASAEVNSFYKNAELTDCATRKEHRKYGLMKGILIQLEQELRERGIYCAYSIARSLSFGMNAVLHHLGYIYRGRLINNCYIFDKLEDMNLWVKNLASDHE